MQSLARIEWPTVALIAAVYALWFALAAFGAPLNPVLWVAAAGILTALYWSIVHEVVHGAAVLTTGARPLHRKDASPQQQRTATFVLPCLDGHLVPVAWTVLWTVVVAIVGGRRLLRRRKARRETTAPIG